MEHHCHVLVLGEAGVGKTALVEKFGDASKTIQAATLETEDDFFWDYQAQPSVSHKDLKVDGAKVKLHITEVSGSRGRMGNYFEVMQAAREAHVVVFCYNASYPWSLTSLEHTLSVVERGRNPPAKKAKGEKKTKGGETQKVPMKKPLPCILVQAKTDLVDNDEGEKLAKQKNIPLVKVSSPSNSGVQEVFEQAARAFLQTKTEPQEKATQEKKAASSSKKEELTSTWQKILAKFLGTEKQDAKVKQEANPQNDVAPVA